MTTYTGQDLAEAVKQERGRRAMSVEAASSLGGVSRELWRVYERDDRLTPKMQQAVAKAFGWPLSWPERPPTPEAPLDRIDQLEAKVDALILQLHELAEYLRDRDGGPR